MYRQRLHYFSYNFDDEELVEQFETFIERNLKEFFTNAEELGVLITVPWARAKSVVNGTGDAQRLKELANTISMAGTSYKNSNLKELHETYIHMEMLKGTTSFEKLMSEIAKYQQILSKESYKWNVVYYSEYLDGTFYL